MFAALKLFFLSFFFLIVFIGKAQVGIGTDNPDNSAELHVETSNKGVLFPRVTSLQMNAIVTPADGLLVYNTDYGVFYYYNGSLAKWVATSISAYSVVSDDDGDTKIVVDNAGDGSENVVHFYANADNNSVFDGNSDKVAELYPDEFNLYSEGLAYGIGGQPVFSLLSDNLFFSNITPSLFGAGNYSVVAGLYSGASLLSGNSNVALGALSGQFLSLGSSNVLVGSGSGKGIVASPLTGDANIALGAQSGMSLEFLAGRNILAGVSSGSDITMGTNNIILGNGSGVNITSGSGNVLIGTGILPEGDVSGFLNIGNVILSSAVYDVSSGIMFADAYTFPTVSGTAQGETFVLQEDKTLVWSDKNIDLSEPNLTVAGASTDMKPFSRLATQDTFPQYPGFVHFIPLTAMSNGTITKLTTFVTCPVATDYTVTMSLMVQHEGTSDTIAYIGSSYAAAEYKFEGSVLVPAGYFGHVTVDFYNGDFSSNTVADKIPDGQPDHRAFTVLVGKKYVITVTANNYNIGYIENSDSDNKGRKQPCSDADGCEIEDLIFNNELIWARAH